MRLSGFKTALVALIVALALGCQDKTPGNQGPPPDPEEVIRESLARLGPEDRRLAEQQRYCPIMSEVRLGQMGTPLEVEVKGKKVFVCCQNCAQVARDDPEQVAQQIRELEQRTGH